MSRGQVNAKSANNTTMAHLQSGHGACSEFKESWLPAMSFIGAGNALC